MLKTRVYQGCRSLCQFLQRWEWGLACIRYGIQALQFYCIPEEIFLRVGVIGEVEPASRWVSLIKCEEMLLAVSVGCGEVDLE